MQYDKNRLEFFATCLRENLTVENLESAMTWVGANPISWCEGAGIESLDLPDIPMCRNELRDQLNCDDPIGLAALVLAWGQMRQVNAKRLFATPTAPWTEIIVDMRNGKHTRAEAYERFAFLRRTPAGKAKGLPGMGPAYYTKLIFFLLRGQSPGYIMDQWTACSVNLLCERDVVLTDVQKTWTLSGKLREAYTVSDENKPENYEEFNQVIEDLSQRTGRSCEHVELALFDQGRGKGIWRNYVVEHRKVPYSFNIDIKEYSLD